MEPNAENVEDISPYVLLRNFSRGRVITSTLLAVIIHVGVIGGLSTTYIYQTWVNPESEAQADASNDQDASAEDAATGDDSKGGDSKNDAEKGDASSSDDDKKSDAPPVVDRVTKKASPDQIPDEPSGLGLSIDDVKE
ncbi:MAG: hypothetical protein N2C14_11060 [Planctomycetales bacterium]